MLSLAHRLQGRAGAAMGESMKTQTKQAGPSSAPEAPARAPAGLAEAMADTPLGRTAQMMCLFGLPSGWQSLVWL